MSEGSARAVVAHTGTVGDFASHIESIEQSRCHPALLGELVDLGSHGSQCNRCFQTLFLIRSELDHM